MDKVPWFTIAIFVFLAWMGWRIGRSPRGDTVGGARYTDEQRQYLRLIAFLLLGVLFLIGVITQRLGHPF